VNDIIGIFTCVSIVAGFPTLVLVLGWWRWRRAKVEPDDPPWRRRWLRDGLAIASVSTLLFDGALIAGLMTNPQSLAEFMVLGTVVGIILSPVSMLGAILGKGPGRFLLAFNSLLMCGYWFMVPMMAI
jgi:hypothetical protein